MRIAFALILSAATLLAAEATPLAERFPAGATAYVEIHDLAGTVDRFLESDLGRRAQAHPAVKAFLDSPKGRQLLLGEALLRGLTDEGVLGNLRVVASRRIAIAWYGTKQRVVLMAEVDPAGVEPILSGLEMAAGALRTEVLPAEEGRAALWQIGEAYLALEGGLLFASPDRMLATAIRNRAAKGLSQSEGYRAARAQVPEDSLLFVAVDLRPFHAQMKAGGLPKDLGQALIMGALPHRLPHAGWAAMGLGVSGRDDQLRVQGSAFIPRDAEESEAVREAFGGTLTALPFALPDRTVGLVRMRRDFESIWTNRDALIAEAGIPGLVEFETNFGNLTSGMSWVEEFLPSVGEEFFFVGMQPQLVANQAAPKLLLPEFAFVWPMTDAAKLERSLRVTFYNTVGIVNASQKGMMEGVSLLPAGETYKGVRIETARYEEPTDGRTGRTLHMRHNFAPSMAVVNGHLVLASNDGIVRSLIDGREGSTPVPPRANSRIELMPEQVRQMLRLNAEQLVARSMLEEGDDRATAESKVDLLLEAARYLREFSITLEEGRTASGVRVQLALKAPGADR